MLWDDTAGNAPFPPLLADDQRELRRYFLCEP